jgi:cytochrome c oxidase subunit 2
MKQTLFAVLMLGAIAHSPSTLLTQQPARTIDIHARRYKFDPSEITLKKGEPVTLRLISDDVPHSLRVPGLAINLEVSHDHPAEMTITPSSVGDFKGECGRFCGIGHGKMKLTIHVMG